MASRLSSPAERYDAESTMRDLSGDAQAGAKTLGGTDRALAAFGLTDRHELAHAVANAPLERLLDALHAVTFTGWDAEPDTARV